MSLDPSSSTLLPQCSGAERALRREQQAVTADIFLKPSSSASILQENCFLRTVGLGAKVSIMRHSLCIEIVVGSGSRNSREDLRRGLWHLCSLITHGF